MKNRFQFLLLLYKIILLVSIGIFNEGCCDTKYIESPPIQDSIRNLIPYKEGITYKFKHSNGLIINFNTSKDSLEDMDFCEFCCDYITQYEIISTNLTPDYPIFDFSLYQNSQYSDLYFDVSIGSESFSVPSSFNSTFYPYVEKFDSLYIGSNYYKKVFKLYGSSYSYNKITIKADSLYYNYEFGILKIIMSNNESYEICE